MKYNIFWWMISISLCFLIQVSIGFNLGIISAIFFIIAFLHDSNIENKIPIQSKGGHNKQCHQ